MGEMQEKTWWSRKRSSPWEICNHCMLPRCPYCLPMNCPTWRGFGKVKTGQEGREDKEVKDDFKKACEWYEKMAEKLHGEHKFKEE